jgi:ABC-type cobalamin/Fe3+-siderophores transport system ATPase subunit
VALRAADVLFANGAQTWVSPDDARVAIASQLRSRIYRFWAERFIVGESPFGNIPVLAPTARNLPEVLNVLDGNPARFQRLNTLLTEILPQVKHVSVRPSSPGQVQIIVWPLDYSTEKDYLAIPLNECGSGIGQVLAILYVVLTSEHPQTIVVDEPQSFLHPGAVRKLIEVLKQFPDHQYIFATHSPTVIAASDPATITMVQTDEGSSLRTINPRDSKDLRIYLSEIGARLSDIFGADNIFWVEGQTEEECFPLILRNANWTLSGTVIVGIRQTGDLQGRDRKKVLEMYRKLSEARTLLPPAIAFVFDQECLTRQQKDDLSGMDPGHVHFLPRRMYENYLLDAAAVAAVMNSIEDFREPPITEEEVTRLFSQKRQQLLDDRGQDLRYFCRGTDKVPDDWVRRIDAAGLLRDVFQDLSGTRVSYDKTTHSVAITEWLIANKPGEIGEIANFLVRLLPR